MHVNIQWMVPLLLSGAMLMGCGSSNTEDDNVTLSLVANGSGYSLVDSAAPPADGAAPPADGAAPPADGAAPPADGAAPPADGAAHPAVVPTPVATPELIPVDEAEVIAECAAVMKNRHVNRIRHHGYHNVLAINPAEPQFIKVSGRNNQLNVIVDVPNGSETAGLCLYVTGHHNKITVNAKSPVAGVLVRVRGNEGTTVINVPRGSYLRGGLVDIRGDDGSVSIMGQGKIICPKALLSKHHASFSCPK